MGLAKPVTAIDRSPVLRAAYLVRLRRFLLAAALAFGLAHPPSAAAQWAVFDASNFAKNALTAAQTASQYAKQLQQYQAQLAQLSAQLQNLNQIPSSVWDSELGHELVAQARGCMEIACVRQAAGQLSDVYGDAAQTAQEGADLYQQSADFSWNLERFSATSGMTPQQIFAYEHARAQAGQQAAETRYDTAKHLQDQLATWDQKAQANAQAAQNAQGARDALQALASQAHLQTTQLSSLVRLNTLNAQAESAREAQDAQDRQEMIRIKQDADARLLSINNSAGTVGGFQVLP